MEEQTCPNCNVDVDPEELKQNRLRCPTCGHDMSDVTEEEWEEEEEGEDFEEDEDEDTDDEDEAEKEES
jgi:uncharacterized Zn finger protein (UPF0148 family)